MSEYSRNRESSREDAIIALGSAAMIRYEGDPADDIMEVRVVFDKSRENKAEGDTATIISADSALGRAILGKRAGDHVPFETGDGSLQIVKIIAVPTPGLD